MALLVKLGFEIVKLFYYSAESIFWSLVPARFKSKDISGQIVLITGAGGSIGRLLALGLAKKGAKIVCWDVAKQANEETVRLVKEAGGLAYSYLIDLTKREDVYRTAERVKKEIGTVDILINNAGVVTGKNLLDCADEDILRTFDVNILSHFWTVKSFLPDMIARNSGHIVSMSSIAGTAGVNRLTDYCAANAAVIGFDDALRIELYVEGHTGIKTTVVIPYIVNTPLFHGAGSKVLPNLEPEHVADDTITAILTEKHECPVSSFEKYIIMLRSLIPVKSQMSSHKFFRIDETMNGFQGSKTKFL